MKDNQQDLIESAADTASAEDTQAAAALGKFKDVQALIDAYTALEAEFTRRSQKLKELQANKQEDAPARDGAASENSASQQAAEGSAVTEEIKNAVIAEYLNGVRAGRSVRFVTGGGAVSAQRRTPADIRQAGALAKNFFDNKEEK